MLTRLIPFSSQHLQEPVAKRPQTLNFINGYAVPCETYRAAPAVVPEPTPAPKSSQCSQACEAKFLQKCGGSHYWCERNENWRCFDDLYRGHSMFEGQCEIACTPTAAMIQPTCDASCQGTFPAGWDVPDSSRPLCTNTAPEPTPIDRFFRSRGERWGAAVVGDHHRRVARLERRVVLATAAGGLALGACLLYTSPSPRDRG